MNENEPNRTEVEAAVLAYVAAPNYQPVKPKVIARKLGYSANQVPHVRRAIKRLVKRHELKWGSKHLVKIAPKTVDQPERSEQPALARRLPQQYQRADELLARGDGQSGRVSPATL